MHVVELVVAELEEIFAVVVLRIDQVRIAEAVVGVSVDAVVADADLAPIAEIPAEVDVGFRLAIAKVGDLEILHVDRQVARLDPDGGRREPGRERIERLVELAGDLRVAPTCT